MRRGRGYIDHYEGRILFDRESHYCVVTEDALAEMHEYSGTLPTAPSAGRIYKRNIHDMRPLPPSWMVVTVENDPEDPRFQLHHAHTALVVDVVSERRPLAIQGHDAEYEPEGLR